MAERTYDDLPDAAVQVVLAVPLAVPAPVGTLPPPAPVPAAGPALSATAPPPPLLTAAPPTVAPAPSVPATDVLPQPAGSSGSAVRGRHADRSRSRGRKAPRRRGSTRRRSPLLEAAMVGLTAAGIVFAVLAVLLVLSDHIWS